MSTGDKFRVSFTEKFYTQQKFLESTDVENISAQSSES